MNILVTGAGGFVDAALVGALRQRGHHVRVLIRRMESVLNLDGLEVEVCVCDVFDKDRLAEAVKGIDIVFHTAGIYRGTPFYKYAPQEIYKTNIEGTRNVCEAALAAGVKKIIYTSSTGAVGMRADRVPSDESVPLNLLNKRSHYEKSKAMAEDVALSYSKKGIEVVSINPSFLFGPKDSRPSPTGEIIVKFLNRIYPCYFDAEFTMSDISMTVDAHIGAIEKGKSGERYIVTRKDIVTMEGLFSLLNSITNVKKPLFKIPLPVLYWFSIVNEAILGILGLEKKIRPIVESESVKYFMLGAKYDGSKAVNEFGLVERPLEDVLREEIDWYIRNGYIRKNLLNFS